jgi:uncharacterized protein YkwD
MLGDARRCTELQEVRSLRTRDLMLRLRRFLVAAAVASACLPAARPQAVQHSKDPWADEDRIKAVVQLSNRQRSRAGLEPLRASKQLTRAAQIHADQLVALDKMAHVLPGARYPKPEDRLRAVGYAWTAFAENLAYGQRTPEVAVDALMSSPGHRKNLLGADYTELGIGYAVDSHGRPYWVQVFGRPL